MTTREAPGTLTTPVRTRRAVITRRGGPEVLAIVEDGLPEPGPGQVQVAILASGVAFGDVMKRYGLVPRMPRLPYTPGYDLVGVVEKVGPGVERWKGGDRVAALVMNGANAERANVTADALVAVPPGGGDGPAAARPAARPEDGWHGVEGQARPGLGARRDAYRLPERGLRRAGACAGGR